MWDSKLIKAELIKRGSSLAQAALIRGLSESACRVALNKPFPSGEKAIAEELGVDVKEIFPERYLKKEARL